MEDLVEKYKGLIPGIQDDFQHQPAFQFQTRDGLYLRTYAISSQNPPKACIINLHGLGSYSRVYAVLLKSLSIHCQILAFDYRGHGKSEGQRAYIRTIDQMIQDAFHFVLQATHRTKLPIFLVGTSFGSTLAVQIAVKFPQLIKGVILLSPAFRSRLRCIPILRCLVYCFACILPFLPTRKGDQTKSSSNENVPYYCSEDPYFFKDYYRVVTIRSVDQGMRRAMRKAPLITSSVFIAHGSEDEVTCINSAKEFFQNLQVIDKEFLEIPRVKHSLCLQNVIYELRETISEWINERI